MIALLLLAALHTPETFHVPESWLNETARLESGGNANAVGDHGQSRGPFQIQRGPWESFSRDPWRVAAHDPVKSRVVARKILQHCARACVRDRRAVTFKNVRWYYRHGRF